MDEGRILWWLKGAERTFSPHALRELIGVVTVAFYDRKVTREAMVEIVQLGVQLHEAVSNIEHAAKLKEAFFKLEGDEDAKKSPQLDGVINGLCTQATALCEQFSNKFELLVQCPTSSDPIN